MGTGNFILSLLGLPETTDEQAMWRVRMDDDHQAFARLVERWETPIVRLCARMTGDQHRAEDLKQEAFARIFARRKEYRAEGKFSTWLWRIALNLCYDELRRRQRLAVEEDGELVRRALQGLPENQRTVLVLRYCEGLKLREIAEILEIPESTAASRIATGLAGITRILEPQFSERKAAPLRTLTLA